MKIAVISDIHANLPALEAVYNHSIKQKVNALYCLGDLVNQNVWNNEVVEFIKYHQIPCVRGNHDEGIGNNNVKFSFSYGSREEFEWGREAIMFTMTQVTEQNKIFLRSLPLNIKLSVKTGGHLRTILFTHGTPESNSERIYQFSKKSGISKLLDNAGAEILLIGNTHASFHTVIEKDNGEFQHIINPGSVGYPKDGSWHACYAVLTIDEHKDVKFSAETITVEFFRLDYDINTVIRAIKKSPLHIYYGMRLLKY